MTFGSPVGRTPREECRGESLSDPAAVWMLPYPVCVCVCVCEWSKSDSFQHSVDDPVFCFELAYLIRPNHHLTFLVDERWSRFQEAIDCLKILFTLYMC